MIKALAITGPTASGKTALSLEIARLLNCEIISCDSMQIYRGMDIGTAKATEQERAEVPHHLIDILEPSESYSAEQYYTDAMAAAYEIQGRGRLPMFVGGTGLYIDTVIRGGVQESPPSNPLYREKLLAGCESEEGIDALWQRLREVDPESAEKIHKNNVRRVARALEIYEMSGKTKTYFDQLSKSVSPDIDVLMITLDFHNRDSLYARVDKRVDVMMSEGLLDEVRALYEQGTLNGDNTASAAIGYKELLIYLRGEVSLNEATELLKQASRRYAKRQLTWFRHEKEAIRIFADYEDGGLKSLDVLCAEAIQKINESGFFK